MRMELWAFKVVEIEGATSGVGFELSASGHPPVVCPEEVGAHVLRYLLDMTANYLGHRQVRMPDVVATHINTQKEVNRDQGPSCYSHVTAGHTIAHVFLSEVTRDTRKAQGPVIDVTAGHKFASIL